MKQLNRELLISYAVAFVSFLMRQPELGGGVVRSIYLFGSVARGDFTQDSDVDVFIDTERENEPVLASAVKKATKNFLHSDERKKFLVLGIRNEMDVKYGNVKEWDLFTSIQKEALVLFSSSVSVFFRKHFFVEVKPIANIAKRNKVIRALAGRKERNRKERGLVSSMGGTVIDSRHYFIPAEKVGAVTQLFAKEKVLYELREMWM